MDIKTFNKNLKVIKASGQKLDALVNETALGGLAIVQEHGDARHIDSLLLVLPQGYRREAFKVWISAFSPIRWNGDGKVGLAKPKSRGYTPFDLEGAAKVTFWDYTKEEVRIEELSIGKFLGVLKRYSEYLDNANENGEITGSDGVVRKHVKPADINRFKAVIEATRAAAVKVAPEAAMPEADKVAA